ncbi:hypothetical protein [Mycobacterium sp. 1274756.6]|uniref:hypothetical protein n=1 Tax=Mycobacterium sp. 1274756.6 TaxID=1834076 RepID=UPI0007FF3E10|nr:hypothetical protein [Mycobacterium sp. 1274756.6]OBJ73590.1 hypothetical protein A5643_03340 [Mycobacterium sp. 1274756.6]
MNRIVIGMVFAAVAAVAAAPLAHADRTVTVREACELTSGPGSYAVKLGIADVGCMPPGGARTGGPPTVAVAVLMAQQFPGSYRVGPGPWADWVIPG